MLTLRSLKLCMQDYLLIEVKCVTESNKVLMGSIELYRHE